MTAQLNALRNGKKLARVSLGDLPAPLRKQLRNTRRYRRELEELTVEAKGEITPTDAHYINEVTACETHASVCKWLLRTKLDAMSTSDILKCSSEILKSQMARSRAIERLRLDAQPADMWAVIDNPPATNGEAEE